MRRMAHIAGFYTATFAAAILSGCIVSDPIYVEYAIDPDLTGEVVVEITGIHSNEEDPVKRAEQFAQYCDEGYRKQGQDWTTIFALEDARTVLTNRTETSCELVVRGTFDSLARSLAVLAGENDYEIRKSGPFFIARLLTGADAEDEGEFTLVVQYTGAILSHNAHEFDEQTGTMTWLGTGMDPSGIQFVLRAEEKTDD